MLYLVEIEDGELKVELDEPKRGAWRAHVDEHNSFDLELLGRDDDGGFIVRVNGVERKFQLDKNCTRYLLSEGDEVSRVRVDHAADIVLQHDHLHGEESSVEVNLLESPITGIVLDVIVRKGQHVDKGDPAVVVEAMKMENTLMACGTGEISEIMVEPGDTVYSGDPLLKIEC
ncbi:MAG: biotin/lipoyl-containing protein [Myxococcota bacterium]